MISIEFVSKKCSNLREQRINIFQELFSDSSPCGIKAFNDFKGFSEVYNESTGYYDLSNSEIPYLSPGQLLSKSIFPRQFDCGIFQIIFEDDFIAHAKRRFSYVIRNIISDFVDFFLSYHPELFVIYIFGTETPSEIQFIKKDLYLKSIQNLTKSSISIHIDFRITDKELSEIYNLLLDIFPKSTFSLRIQELPNHILKTMWTRIDL